MTHIRTKLYTQRKQRAARTSARVLDSTQRDALAMAIDNLRNAIRALETPAAPGLVPSPVTVALAELRNAARHLSLVE